MNNFENLTAKLIVENIVDSKSVSELMLYIDNNAQLHRQQFIPIVKNFKRKKAKGNFNASLAIKGMRNLVDNGAKMYSKEFAGGVQDAKTLFPGPVRNEVAKELAIRVAQQIDSGEFDSI